MDNSFRSGCPITSTLDLIGDKWTLVIIRDMLLSGMQSFKEFSCSEESIATNILTSRLKKLEEFKIITKEKIEGNKKSNFYRLTEKGISLTPVIVEFTLWGCDNMKEFNTEIQSNEFFESMKKDKEGFVKMIIENYKEKIYNTKIEA